MKHMDIDLNEQAFLSEQTYDTGEVQGGMNRASGTVREMIALALAFPPEKFGKVSIQTETAGSLRSSDIRETAAAHGIKPN